MEKLIIIKTLDQLKELELHLSELDEEEFIALDTETNGVNKDSRIIGLSLCWNIEIAYYVILAQWDKDLNELVWLDTSKYIHNLIKKLIGRKLVLQNAPFDCSMIRNNYKIDLMPSVHTDTLILGHVLNENRSNGLKERGVELYGEDARAEQALMKESVIANGGVLNKKHYELYKADADLIAHYGAKDAILTLKVFYNDVPLLYEEGLDQFFYEDESMPLLRNTTYDLNTIGLRVDPEKLKNLKATLEADCSEAEAFIKKETYEHVKEKYPATGKTNHFNFNSNNQLSWLLFEKLEQDFNLLTDVGKEVCKALEIPLPYSNKAKRHFIETVRNSQGIVWKEGYFDKKKQKEVKPKVVVEPYKYMACGRETLAKFSTKYKWVEKLLEHKKNSKLLSTYVLGIQDRMQYNIIRPSFMQHGTTSGRYSSKAPNFQNLPREDKRTKACIVARQGKVFVGADYSQLEPRVFASLSNDQRLIDCFKKGQDFYSVIGVSVFGKQGASLFKDDKDSFAKLYPNERQISKVIALAATYGANAYRLSALTKQSVEDTEAILQQYFKDFPSVKKMMEDAHTSVKKEGIVKNIFGRPRRMPLAMKIDRLYGNAENLPYEFKNLLNLAVNHRIQSTAASIMNRASIAFCARRNELCKKNAQWKEVSVVMQVHDELIVEAPEVLKQETIDLLKDSMENTVTLPNVALIAEPKAAYSLADLK